MNCKSDIRRIIFLILAVFCLVKTYAQKKIVRPHPSSTISFVKNAGQWKEPFLYKADIPGGTMFLEKTGITFNFISETSRNELHDLLHSYFSSSTLKTVVAHFHAFNMTFKNCNPKIMIQEEEKQTNYQNYYIGNDPAFWRSGVPLFNKVVYQDVYPAIDYEIFTSANSFKYNFIVNPGADYHQIVMQYQHCELQPDNGRLKIKTSVNEMLEAEPYAYQIINEKKVQVPCRFEVHNNEVSFVVGDYQSDFPLVIDPIIIFATYSGSTVDNFGFTAAFDSEEHLYSAGITKANGYPVTAGAFQTTFQGGSGRIFFYGVDIASGWDVTISKYDSSGTNLLFATYLGGKSNEYPHSLLVDHSDNLVVLGTTFSSNFPHSINAFDTTLNPNDSFTDIYIARFDPSGKFNAATFIGGDNFDGNNIGAALEYNYADEFRGDIISDYNNNYYIGSVTYSANFPVKNAIQSLKKNGYDGVVFKIDSNLSKLSWSTFLGGDADDAVYSVDLDKSLHVYVSGGTQSNNFPTTNNSYQKNKSSTSGDADGFITKISNDGQSFIGSTYIGTNGYDQVYFIEIDKDGNVFGTGQTEGNFPVSSGVYSVSNGSQFIIKLDADLKTKLLSTVFGTGRLKSTHPDPDISPTAFLVDNCDLIYVCGWGSDIGIGHGGGTTNLLVTSTFPPIYNTTDGNDFYIIVFNKDFKSVKFNTYIGGSQSEDHVDGGTSRFDKKGIIYAAVCASCGGGSDFPTQPPSVKFPANKSPRCSNAAFKIAFQLQTSIIASFRPTPRIGCVPQMVAMNNKSNAVRVRWDFGDGTTDTAYDPSHLYTKTGTYKIMLICEDTNTCNSFDTAFDEITLYDQAVADFSHEISFCESSVTLKNKSTNQIKYLWDFGDGTLDSLTENPKHYYTQSGKYTVTLYINKGMQCSDSMVKEIDFDKFKPTPPIIPNVFTPNGDGRNDVFEIGGVNPKCDSIEMKIYNRWGLLVFESNEIGNWWNGKDKNKPLPEGVYYYTIKVTDYKGNITRRKGDVTIIR